MTSAKVPRGSTTEIKTTQFAPHGRVDMWMEGDVLHYEATGPFNKEVMDCLAVAQSNFVQGLTINGPWGSICTLRESAMGTPDGLQRYEDLMRAAKGPNRAPVATAFVIGPEIEGGKIMAPLYSKIYAAIGRPFRIFATMDEALPWVRSAVAQAQQR